MEGETMRLRKVCKRKFTDVIAVTLILALSRAKGALAQEFPSTRLC
jgi:hypothetical protein